MMNRKTKEASLPGREDYVYSHEIPNGNGTSKYDEHCKKLTTKEKLVDRFKDFCDKTTAHGAKRILIAHNGFARLLWILAILVSVVILLWQVRHLSQKYSSHEKITDISVLQQ